MFEKIKRFYKLGLYSSDLVYDFVKKGIITEELYVLITGENRS